MTSLLSSADWQKTEAQKRREQLLLDELVALVNKRDALVRDLDAQEKQWVAVGSGPRLYRLLRGPEVFGNFSPEVSSGPGSLPLAPWCPYPLGRGVQGEKGEPVCPLWRKIILFSVRLTGPKKKMSIWSELWSKTKARWPRKKRNVFFSSSRTRLFAHILVLGPQTRKSQTCCWFKTFNILFGWIVLIYHHHHHPFSSFPDNTHSFKDFFEWVNHFLEIMWNRFADTLWMINIGSVQETIRRKEHPTLIFWWEEIWKHFFFVNSIMMVGGG